VAAVILAGALAQLMAAAPALAQQERVTIAFEDVAAADALMQFRWVAGVPVVYQPPPDVRISLILQDVPLDHALTTLCEQMGYEWRKVGRVYVLGPAERKPLLPAPADLESRFLYPERQRLDAARLMLALTRTQVARAAEGDGLQYSELSRRQQEILARIWGRLTAAARAGWIGGAGALDTASAAPPPESLAFSIRGYVWRVEEPQAVPPQPSPQPTPQEQSAQPPEEPPEEVPGLAGAIEWLEAPPPSEEPPEEAPLATAE